MSRSNAVKIRVTVLCARNLAKRDLFRLPDPFVRVCVDNSGQTHATESCKQTLDPKWNQHYDLFLSKTDSVTISVWDDKKVHKKKGAGSGGAGWLRAPDGEQGDVAILNRYPYMALTVWGDTERCGFRGWSGDV